MYKCISLIGENNILVPHQPTPGSPGPQGSSVQAVFLLAGKLGLRQIIQYVFRIRRLPRDILCAVLTYVQDCQVSLV